MGLGGSRKAFQVYQDARKVLAARREERACISAQKRRFINNPPGDRMARNDIFRYWMKRPTAESNACAGNVSARNYRDAAGEIFEMLDAFDYDSTVKVWIQREGGLAGPFCWGATPWDTGDFSNLQAYPKEAV